MNTATLSLTWGSLIPANDTLHWNTNSNKSRVYPSTKVVLIFNKNLNNVEILQNKFILQNVLFEKLGGIGFIEETFHKKWNPSSIYPLSRAHLRLLRAKQSTMNGISSNGRTILMDLPDHIITKILCTLPPESVSCASKSCSALHKIINSADFYKAYVKPHGWIVADCGGAECDPALLFYNTCSNFWKPMAIPDLCRDHFLCNPRMVSASGGLILFQATIETPCFGGHKGKQKVTGSTLVVVNPLTKQSRILPDPPVELISAKQCIEMVSLGNSYKVILFTTRMPNKIFVYNSTDQIWKKVEMSDSIIPSGDSTTVHSSTGVFHKFVLFWLICIHPSASYLVLYNMKKDCVKRKACFSERVYGIGVRSFGIVGVTKKGLCRLDLKRFRWVDLSSPSDFVQVLGRFMNVDFVCSSEEDDMIWVLSLDDGRSAGNFKFRGWTLRKHMDLISYQFCSKKWRRLCPCFIQSNSPMAAPTRAISTAKWCKWQFEACP